jgi:hypothetical protein
MEFDSLFGAPALTYVTMTASPDIRKTYDLKYSPLAYVGEIASCHAPQTFNKVAAGAFSILTIPGAYAGHAVGWGLGKVTEAGYHSHAPYLIGPCND